VVRLPIFRFGVDAPVLTCPSSTDSEGTLFRATSTVCKIFNHFAKYIGMPFLWQHLAFFINQLHEFGKEERKADRESILGPGTMEVDPERDLEDDEAPIDEVDLRLNQYELLLRASQLLKSVLKSANDLPPYVIPVVNTPVACELLLPTMP
jgi:hypothetical protein